METATAAVAGTQAPGADGMRRTITTEAIATITHTHAHAQRSGRAERRMKARKPPTASNCTAARSEAQISGISTFRPSQRDRAMAPTTSEREAATTGQSHTPATGASAAAMVEREWHARPILARPTCPCAGYIDPMDQIVIRDLLVRGIVGINPDERTKPQDILVNVTMWADTRAAAASDDIEDAVNYRTITKAIVAHIEAGDPMLVERLVAEIADICLDADERVEEVEVAVEKPGALRFARSVGVVDPPTPGRGDDSLASGAGVAGQQHRTRTQHPGCHRTPRRGRVLQRPGGQSRLRESGGGSRRPRDRSRTPRC